MKTWKLTIAYDGTRYLGWQKLGERGAKDYERTIQGKLETLLSRMTGEEIELNGAGRTDAGVHAAGQTASFRTERTFSPEEITAYCNRYLPSDIAVLAAEEMPERFHARLHARGKLYCYRVNNGSRTDVFRQRFEYRVADALDREAMEDAARRLCGTHDFRPFCASKRTKKSTVRTVDRIDLVWDGDKLTIRFHGNGFLYNMVRILTGTLIEVGLGRIRPQEMDAIFRGERRAGYTAPPHGLTLEHVDYDGEPNRA